MEKENKRNKRKNLIKKVLIGIGIVGVSILTIRAIIRGRQKKNECRNIRVACEPSVKTKVIPPKKKAQQSNYNEAAILSQCNQLLKTLWQSRNPASKLYFDDEICVDIKDCPFPPYISQDA